jgi:hypothetical protein
MWFGCWYFSAFICFPIWLRNDMFPVTEPKSPTETSFQQGRESVVRTMVALFGAPTAWTIQLLVSEPLVAHACYPYQIPLSVPIWERLPLLLVVISLLCLAVALLSGFIAWSSWMQARNSPAVAGNDNETKVRRRRFVGRLGVMSSSIFIVAVIFNICALFMTPLCSSWF